MIDKFLAADGGAEANERKRGRLFFFLKNQMETSDYVQYPTTFLVRSTSFEILTLTFIYLLLPKFNVVWC